MKPAETLAALKAVHAAIGEQIKTAEESVHEVRASTGARSFDTGIGTVSVAIRKSSLYYTDAELVEWAKANGHHELIVETASEPLKKLVKERFQVDGDEVLDTETGEVTDWPRRREGGSEYLTVRLTDDAKSQALDAVQSRSELITGLLEIGND